ncbi:cytochrome C oxidase subunit II (plasmid) [Haloferacaceae archaeon DSL9]
MTSPLKPPEGNWWDTPVNRRETIWLGLGGLWSLILFGWMSAWARIGEQNPIGETYRVSAEEYREKMEAYKAEATEADDGLVPPGEDVYLAGMRYHWDGAPVVLETDTTYRLHLSSYDVQHGFSLRPEGVLSKHTNLQVLPGYEWVLRMEFDEADTYHILCNEFCGEGHRTMHGTIVVKEGRS